MSTVYQHQLHGHRPRRKHTKAMFIILAVVIAAAIGGGLFMLKPDTKITGAKVVTHTLSVTATTKTWTEGQFSIALPKGWTFTGEQKDIYDIYHFKSPTDPDAGNRLLDVYQDSNLPNFAINRMVPVDATDDGHLTAQISQVSDNCTAYTTDSTASSSAASQQAKWQGITFLCDMVNPLRNVVGTGSTDGINTVNVNSLSTGKHHYFLTYTDANDKPDYSIFVAAINSFQVAQ